MRNILILCGLILLLGIFWVFGTFNQKSHYGERFSSASKVDLIDLLQDPKSHLGKKILITSQVEDQCPVSGCFFYFTEGSKRLKVELSDIAQSLPQKMGHKATVEGQLVESGDGYQLLGTAVEFE